MENNIALDFGIENLLDLDGVIIEIDDELEYLVNFDVNRVEISDGRPHGIKYSLTLHDKWGNRLLGFDNAHQIKEETNGGFVRHRTLKKYDHKHKFKDVSVIIPYEYETAEKLLTDFWIYVDEAVESDRKRKMK